ncbi:MAG: DUF4458 domain-containing protein [Bacteroidaceae bacterium]|nr:DUF4458 domain-containing protein [Bacteroidaceae bacterium]
MNRIRIYLMLLIMSLTGVALVGCSEEDENQTVQYGYVQFKVGQAATRSVDRLESIADAKKIKVYLQCDGHTIEQTLLLNAYNEESAEYGLRSDKLRLLPGEYSLIGYVLYDQLDKVIQTRDVEGCVFEIVPGGLYVQHITPDVVERGRVSFKLVKEGLQTRGVGSDGYYPFSDIKTVDITVQNLFTKELTTFEKIAVKYTEGFGQGSADETLYPGANAETSYALCDTLVWLKAGEYRVHHCVTYSDKKGKTTLAVENNSTQETFVVENDVDTKDVNVPINMSETAEYIKDYVALKEIWEALDGPNWSYVGDALADGVNWNFNKDIDLWGQQPGVQLDANGRVATISLEGFGPKGVVPDAIGQLTELSILYLSSHSDLLGGHLFGRITPDMTAEQMSAIRMDYADRVLEKDFRTGYSALWQKTIEMDPNEKPIRKGISLKGIHFGDMTNGIVGISKALQRCTNLQQFFIANCPIEVDSFFRDIEPGSPYENDSLSWENLTNLYDIEIFNCPKLKGLPVDMLTALPELQMLNVASNKGISGEQLKADWEAIINGNCGDRLQVLYLGFNNLEETPSYDELRKMTKLGMIDCTNNQLKTVHPFGKEITLAKVYFDYNKIEKLTAAPDGYFCGYSQLESFSAKNNEMTLFPDIFNAKSVYVMQSVDFSYNKISGFENGDNFKGINSSAVNITNNRLETFPGILFKTGSPMNQLILAGNGMKEIPKGSLEGDKTYLLEALDLSYNYLSELPDDFYARTLPYLSGMDLSYNRFSSFPTKPLSISTLSRFFIRYQRDENGNRILKEWPTGLYTCPSMAVFCIGGNDLRKIEDTISPYIMYFEIADNPNISIDMSSVCDYIYAGYYTLIYDRTQDIRGCDAIVLDN